MNHKILVPIDFTDVTENALRFALDIARLFDTGISLLHIVSKTEEKLKAEDKLNALINKYASHGIGMKSYTKTGNIIDGIGEAAEELESIVVIMGTHGMKGLQYLLGSKAIRVVTNSNVPFIITQARVRKDDKFDNIVVPMDMAQEDKQILGVVIRSAKILQAKVHLFVSKYTDEFTINTVNRNVAFAKKHLAENGIEYTVSYAENMKDFDDQLISFANLLEADIIAIVNHREDGINNLLGGNFDQKVITNRAGIPVLIINTKNTTNVGDIFRSFA